MKDKFVIWGSAGHAKVLSELIHLQGGEVVALFDNNLNAVSVLPGVPLFIGEKSFREWESHNGRKASLCGIVAIGGSRGSDRIYIQKIFREHHLKIPTLVHPYASVSSTVILGEGTQVLAHSLVAADTQIGEACIINHRSSVDHECLIGDGVHIAPGATLCGCITVANNVMIGAGSVVLPRLEIGKNTIVGAGAVVTRNLPENVVAFGNPARIIRSIP